MQTTRTGDAGGDPFEGTETLEEVLASTEQAVDGALKSAAQVTRQLRLALAGARTGQIRDVRKALAAVQAAATGLAEQAQGLHDGFDPDEQAYLGSGGYTKELLALAAARGVTIVEEDDLLVCYPSLLRVLSSDVAVEIDKVKERRIRPSVLVDLLAKTQQRAPRFKAEQFLDSLRGAYELLVASQHKKSDAVVKLVEVWSTLTMLPGQRGQYSKQEFARDLYLLDQSGVTSTPRSARELRLAASTGTKGAGVLVTVARGGQRQYYWGVSFTPAVDAAPEAG